MNTSKDINKTVDKADQAKAAAKEVDKPSVVRGPKACVAVFIRPSDGKQIFVYPRNGESKETAIQRVMKRNGAEGGHYDYCK